MIGWMTAKVKSPLQWEVLLQRRAEALKLGLPSRRPPLYLSGLSGASVFSSLGFPFLPHTCCGRWHRPQPGEVPPPSHRQPESKREAPREADLLRRDFNRLGIWAKASANGKMFLYLISPSVCMGQDLGVRMLSPHRTPFSISTLVSE